MMSPTTHPLLADYLARLRVAARQLPAEDAAALVADIEEHIEAATASGVSTEADVRNLLDRLGTPEALVAEMMPPPVTPVAPVSARRLESPAIILLFVAELLALTFLGVGLGALAWIVGLVLVGLATRWTSREKWRAAAVLGSGYPITAIGMLLGGLVAFRTASGPCAGTPNGAQTCTDGASTSAWVPIVAGVLYLGYLALQSVTARRLMRAAR
ncbi:MAG: hypothetical protein U0Q21_12325 [Dermatophilaceae bacterium]